MDANVVEVQKIHENVKSMQTLRLDSFDPDSSPLEVTRGPEVVHHAVLAPILRPDLQLPHGLQLGLGHLHRLPGIIGL